MILRSTKIFLEALGTLLAALAIGAAALAWRLSEGPISLDLVTPYLEQAVADPGGAYRVKLDRTVLVWTDQERHLSLHVIGVHVVDTQGQSLATLPEVAIGISVRALLHGMLAPTSLEVFGAHAHVRRDENGRLDLAFNDEKRAAGAPGVMPVLVESLLQPVSAGRPLSYLRDVAITDADLAIDDAHWDTSWNARLDHLILERSPNGIEASAALDLTVGAVTSHIAARADYVAAAHEANVRVGFRDLEPAAFTHVAAALAPLARIALPLAGTLSARLDTHGVVDDLSFEVAGGAGSIALPEFYAQDVPIKRFVAKGSLAAHGTKAVLDEATIDLGGPSITLAGSAVGLDGESTVALDVTARNFKVDEFPQRWPESIARNARAWIIANLSGGTVDLLQAHLDAHGKTDDPDSLAVDQLSGTIKVSDVDVRYLGKMPPVRGVSGDIRFDRQAMVIAMNKGGVDGLALDDSKVTISGLDGHDQDMDIDLSMHGSLADAMRLIDQPPLGYASALGFDPKTATGDIATRLKMQFPLVKALGLAQVRVDTESTLKDVGLTDVFFGHDASHGNMKLHVTKDGMELSGTADIATAPVSLDWSESFTKAPKRRIQVKGTLDDDARRTLDLDPEHMLAGPVPMELVLNRAGTGRRNTQIDIDLDLAKAALTFPRFSWRKEPGVAGKAHIVLLMTGDKLSAVREARIEGPDFAVRAQAGFDGDGRLESVTAPRLAFGHTRANVTLNRRADGTYAIAIDGAGFDAAGFLKGDKEKKPDQRGPKLAILINVDKLWLSDSVDLPFGPASGAIDYDGLHIARANVVAKTMSGGALNFQVAPGPKGRQININSDNAGEVMKGLDALDNMVGGKLKIAGTFDDAKPESPLAGTLRIDDYQLLKAPFFAKLLSLASLTGILDTMQGNGIGFSTLIASFTKTNGRVAIADGRTAGSELGLTFEGALDFDANSMNINGTIVPIYTLNSLLGNIPFLGSILVGPKGGGVFAATYQASGTIDDPDVSVNPLSALAPGILRGFLDIFSSGNKPPPAPPAPNPPPAAPVPAPAPVQAPTGTK